MSEINYVRSHRLPLARAKKIAQQTADDLARQYDLTSQWEGDTLHFQRSGVDGHMHVTTAEIALHVKLGFLLRPFKARFEQHIERHLEELLARATPQTARRGAAGAKAAAKPGGRRG